MLPRDRLPYPSLAMNMNSQALLAVSLVASLGAVLLFGWLIRLDPRASDGERVRLRRVLSCVTTPGKRAVAVHVLAPGPPARASA